MLGLFHPSAVLQDHLDCLKENKTPSNSLLLLLFSFQLFQKQWLEDLFAISYNHY